VSGKSAEAQMAGPVEDFPLADHEFARIQALILSFAGITLADTKRVLVMSRLGKLVRAMRLGGYAAYIDMLEHSATAADRQAFVNALTTNLTRFFREAHHFEHLVAHVGQLMRQPRRFAADGRPRLRVWSAGCSSGQEPYSAAIALMQSFPALSGWDFRILATDIDTDMLGRAGEGVYPMREIGELDAVLRRNFVKLDEGNVRVGQSLRDLVAFKPLNLNGQWPMKGPFDAIFCRNVAIYFDRATQDRLFGRLGGMLAPDGVLYLGHSENAGSGQTALQLMGKTIYRLNPQRARNAA
jgi:chemotaxis protein methyltransferase CheR